MINIFKLIRDIFRAQKKYKNSFLLNKKLLYKGEYITIWVKEGEGLKTQLGYRSTYDCGWYTTTGGDREYIAVYEERFNDILFEFIIEAKAQIDFVIIKGNELVLFKNKLSHFIL